MITINSVFNYVDIENGEKIRVIEIKDNDIYVVNIETATSMPRKENLDRINEEIENQKLIEIKDPFTRIIKDKELSSIEIMKRNEVYIIENANLETIKAYRNVILKAMKNNKVFSRTDIRNKCKKEYTYLYRYDKDWFLSNLPIKVKVNLDNRRIDWKERDNQYLKLLKEKYKEIIDNEPIIRITKGSLAKPLGIL
jgi:hypothetical protein